MIKWKSLIHSGPLFIPDYVPSKTKILFKNKLVTLKPQAEEYAVLYAKLNNKKPNISKNFWKDFGPMVQYLGAKSLNEFDFSNYLGKKSQARSPVKKTVHAECIVDGKKYKVDNFRMEPPSIFIGRGDHPLAGRIKLRVYPEDVTLNLSSSTPKPNVKGKWHSIVKDQTSVWLCSWTDSLTGRKKYIFSKEAFNNDVEKFELARQLYKNVTKIEKQYLNFLNSEYVQDRQLAVAVYLVHNCALRVGNSKSENEADTVGVSTLKSQNVELLPRNEIQLDFLGKDSLRYEKRIKVLPSVYENLKMLKKDLKDNDMIFDEIDSTTVNQFLNYLMPNLTSKVWRTYNASTLYERELGKIKSLENLAKKLRAANEKVSELCNHKTADGKYNLSTSTNNYIDPRIVFAFAHKMKIDPNEIYSAVQLKKFQWASKTTKFKF
jgi:DNA topoisomerase-1